MSEEKMIDPEIARLKAAHAQAIQALQSTYQTTIRELNERINFQEDEKNAMYQLTQEMTAANISLKTKILRGDKIVAQLNQEQKNQSEAFNVMLTGKVKENEMLKEKYQSTLQINEDLHSKISDQRAEQASIIKKLGT